jgi:hypothetical protein
MGLLGAILFFFIVVHMKDFWYNYKFTHNVGYKEYRTDVLSNVTTVTDFVPADPNFEHASTTDNVEIVRVKDIHTLVSTSFHNIWYVIYMLLQWAPYRSTCCMVFRAHSRHWAGRTENTARWLSLSAPGSSRLLYPQPLP